MVTARDANWTVRVAAFVLWAGAAASAVYWGMRLSGTGGTGSVQSVGARQPAPDSSAIAKLLGQGNGPSTVTASAPAPSRYHLLGVVSDASKQGAALIAVDGRPAKPYRVGTAIDDGVVLQSVAPRRAVLANASGATVATLEMPQPGLPQSGPAQPGLAQR